MCQALKIWIENPAEDSELISGRKSGPWPTRSTTVYEILIELMMWTVDKHIFNK